MHSILLVYKHKYMTNKISHFLQMASRVTEEQQQKTYWILKDPLVIVKVFNSIQFNTNTK